MKRNLEPIALLKLQSMGDIKEKVKEGFDLIGGLKLSSTDSVVIKPNLCAIKTCETGCTTDPRVVEGLIAYLRDEFGISDICVVESDGGQVLADMAFKLLGYERLAERLNVKLVNLSKCRFSERIFPENTFLKKIKVPEIMEKADCFISIPKIKTNDMCFFTATLKNQYGCNPVQNKPKYHHRLDEAIVDLNVVFKPDLVLVDGIVAMNGPKGPTDGIPLRLNSLIFGRDPVAVDHLVATIMGINPNKVSYLVKAKKRGLGTSSYETVGANPEEIQRKFWIKKPRWHNLYGLLEEYRRN